jgi:hypothetical protein
MFSSSIDIRNRDGAARTSKRWSAASGSACESAR